MGRLYEYKQKINAAITAKGLEPVKVMGAIALKSGVLVSVVTPATPDDRVKLQKVAAAAREVLGLNLGEGGEP